MADGINVDFKELRALKDEVARLRVELDTVRAGRNSEDRDPAALARRAQTLLAEQEERNSIGAHEYEIHAGRLKKPIRMRTNADSIDEAKREVEPRYGLRPLPGKVRITKIR
jgi:hypothetical protein